MTNPNTGAYDADYQCPAVVVRADRSATAGVTVPVQGAPVTLTERSGAMTTGGTSQQLAAANTLRKYLFIQNPVTLTGQNIAAAETLFVRFGATAAGVNNGTSIELVPGASITFEGNAIPTAAIQVNAATTAHRWIALEG